MDKDSSFAVLGKVVAILLVIGVLVVGGFFLGQKGKGSSKATPTPTPEDILTTPAPIGKPILEPSGTTAADTANPQVLNVAAGSAQFGYYAIAYPSDWTPQHEAGGGIDRLTLSKGGYQIAISQGAGGSGSCEYGKEVTPQPQSQQFATYVEFRNASTAYRRGVHQEEDTTFTICQLKDAGFVYPTIFGYITYTTPLDPDTQVLGLMDRMVGSMTPKSQ